jgi:DNA-binding response OmpR family regulator
LLNPFLAGFLSMHILVAEDDLPVAKFLSSGLEAEHYNVRLVTGGGDVLPMLENSPCDLLILDLNLPGMNGLDALRIVRSSRPHLPVLILTGNARVEDRVGGLDLGADDYLTKPFAFSELLARVRALLRRGSLPFEPTLHTLDLELDRVRRFVQRNGRAIELTPKEFALLEYLMLHAGRNVTRSSIIQHVWKLSSETMTNVVDVYINYLRKKIDADGGERLIHTVRGAGYRIGPRPRASR